MKTKFKYAIFAFLAFFATSASIAQEWTKEQKELWMTVESMWSKWKTGDVDGVSATFHPKYQGWNADMPLPMGKEKMVQMFKDMKDMMKIDYYNVEPARIIITDNAAIVDYYFSYSVTMTMGDDKKQEEGKGKNSEFYVKEGGKWLLLGDMSVYEDKEDDD